MFQQNLSIGPAAEIYIDQVDGDLRIKGWGQPEGYIRINSEEDLSIQQENDIVHIICRNDCNVRIPASTSIHIGQVRGDARITTLENPLIIDRVNGSIVLRNVADLQLDSVNGDFLAKDISGNLLVGQAQGDVFINHGSKDCTIQQASGDLHIQDVNGNISATGDGHISVQLNKFTGSQSHINSLGDIHFHVAEELNARVTLKSNANHIKVLIPKEKNIFEEPEKQITLGDGLAQIMLTAEGKVIFSSHETTNPDMGDFDEVLNNDFQDLSNEYMRQMNDQFENQMALLNDHMEKLSETLNQTLLPSEEVDRMVARARESSVIAAKRAQEKMQRAQERLEIKLEAAKRKTEAKAAKVGRPARDRSDVHIRLDLRSKPTPPKESIVSKEERLMILKMLEQKKITLDEAENLLRTLEGKEG